jgi:hypothetical protein
MIRVWSCLWHQTVAISLSVVIVGGGFAGVTLAQHLDKQFGNAIKIIVISRDNHLVFTPILPEAAARTISPRHVVVAGRQMTKRTPWIAASTTGSDLDSTSASASLISHTVASTVSGNYHDDGCLLTAVSPPRHQPALMVRLADSPMLPPAVQLMKLQLHHAPSGVQYARTPGTGLVFRDVPQGS